MFVSIITSPASEPVSLAEAKEHLRVDIADDDDLISSLIISARLHAEQFVRRQFITATLRLTLDQFRPFIVDIPRPPIQSISSIKYIDTAGVQITLATNLFKTDTTSEPGRVSPAFGETWPVTRHEMNSVEIEYIAGYGTESKVPDALKQAILILLADMYENRELQMPISRLSENQTFERLLWPFRIMDGL